MTIAHSRTRDLAGTVRRADIVVAAVGRPELIRGDWIKPGATVIDVGMNRVPAAEKAAARSRLVGDVAFAEAARVAGAITPVPGGVGPMTIALLMANTFVAACRQKGLPVPDLFGDPPRLRAAGMPAGQRLARIRQRRINSLSKALGLRRTSRQRSFRACCSSRSNPARSDCAKAAVTAPDPAPPPATDVSGSRRSEAN